MIFIGAGVPLVFGVPGLTEMTRIVMNRLKDDGSMVEQIKLVCDRLANRGFQTDIENVLTVLEAIVHPYTVYSEIGPKIAALEISGTIKAVTDIEKLTAAIKKSVKDLCLNPDWEKAQLFYDGLFKALNHIGKINGSYKTMNVLKGTIVTTNYDMSIEESLQHSGMQIFDGFEYNNAKREQVFTGKWMTDDADPESGVNLVKIHGSVDYYKLEDNTIIRDPSSVRLGRERRRQELLIYPAGEKSITSTPYYDLYSMFRHQLLKGDHAVALGFSFRDFAIRNIFADWLSLNPRARLIVYSLHADRIRPLYFLRLFSQE